jgi:hypothetical protein
MPSTVTPCWNKSRLNSLTPTRCSYKLWYKYLVERRKATKGLSPTGVARTRSPTPLTHFHTSHTVVAGSVARCRSEGSTWSAPLLLSTCSPVHSVRYGRSGAERCEPCVRASSCLHAQGETLSAPSSSRPSTNGPSCSPSCSPTRVCVCVCVCVLPPVHSLGLHSLGTSIYPDFATRAFQMPRIWTDYLKYITAQRYVTKVRRAFDQALLSLPVTQHHRVWPLYLSFIKVSQIVLMLRLAQSPWCRGILAL